MENAFCSTQNAILLHSSIQTFDSFLLLAQKFMVSEEKLKIEQLYHHEMAWIDYQL